jgi:hypothetical protein
MNKEMEKYLSRSANVNQDNLSKTMLQHSLKSRWAGVYTLLNNNPSRDYCEDSFFYSRILPRLNRLQFVNAYRDKNFYDQTVLNKYTVPALARKISGRLYDHAYKPISLCELKSILENADDDVVIKPAIDSGSGQAVWIGSSKDAFDCFLKYTTSNLIIQKKCTSHLFFSSIHPSSLNTVRINTLFTGSRYVCLGSVLRVGQHGSKVDNQGADGLAIGISETGIFKAYGYDKFYNKVKRHPDSGFVFEGQAVPYYEDMKSLCLDLHRYFPHFGLIGWDMAVDEGNNIKIIEVNLKWVAISLIQVAHGPVFGLYKDEIKKNYALPDWEHVT